jgi:hypothetical protein
MHVSNSQSICGIGFIRFFMLSREFIRRLAVETHYPHAESDLSDFIASAANLPQAHRRVFDGQAARPHFLPLAFYST